MKKEFSVLKWFVFPIFAIACGSIIASFNIRVFGLADSLPYLFAFGCIVAFSIMLGHYLSSDDPVVVKTAYVCELLLALSLAVITVYSLYVQRELLVVKNQSEQSLATIQAISGLKSRSAQAAAVRQIDLKDNSATVFKEHEKRLFIAAMVEFGAFLFCAFLLLGITHLRKADLRLNSENERLNSDTDISELSLNNRQAVLKQSRDVSFMNHRPKVANKTVTNAILFEQKGKPKIRLYPVPGGFKIHLDSVYKSYISEKDYKAKIKTYADIETYLKAKGVI